MESERAEPRAVDEDTEVIPAVDALADEPPAADEELPAPEPSVEPDLRTLIAVVAAIFVVGLVVLALRRRRR